MYLYRVSGWAAFFFLRLPSFPLAQRKCSFRRRCSPPTAALAAVTTSLLAFSEASLVQKVVPCNYSCKKIEQPQLLYHFTELRKPEPCWKQPLHWSGVRTPALRCWWAACSYSRACFAHISDCFNQNLQLCCVCAKGSNRLAKEHLVSSSLRVASLAALPLTWPYWSL